MTFSKNTFDQSYHHFLVKTLIKVRTVSFLKCETPLQMRQEASVMFKEWIDKHKRELTELQSYDLNCDQSDEVLF